MSGVVHGIGTGPGDPELLTARAIRILSAAEDVFYLEADGKPSRALATVRQHLPEQITHHPIPMPMRPDPAQGAAAYDIAAAEILERADAGQTIAVLCEGDPLLYGSFVHLMERLQGQASIEITPGIPSFVAAGCAIGKGIARRTESVMLIPGTTDEKRLLESLEITDFAAIMKTGRHLPKVRKALATSGFCDVQVIEEASAANQRIRPLSEIDGDALPYFSIILAWREHRP